MANDKYNRKHAKQYKTTFSMAWEKKLLNTLDRTGENIASFLRIAAKKEIEHQESKLKK